MNNEKRISTLLKQQLNLVCTVRQTLKVGFSIKTKASECHEIQ